MCPQHKVQGLHVGARAQLLSSAGGWWVRGTASQRAGPRDTPQGRTGTMYFTHGC